jgi:hypothetical protein
METPKTQMRLTDEERIGLEMIKIEYGCRDWTDVVRMMLGHFIAAKPIVRRGPVAPKKIPKKVSRTA